MSDKQKNVNEKNKFWNWFPSILSSIITMIAMLTVAIVTGIFDSRNMNDQNLSATQISAIEKIPEYLTLNDNLQKEIQELRAQVNQLTVENNRLLLIQELKIDAITAYFQYIPLPAWLKIYDPGIDDFIMNDINLAYEREWGISEFQYEGKTDAEVWGEEVAKEFRENDFIVINSRDAILTQETVPDSPNDPSNSRMWFIIKFPVIISDKTYIGVGGIAIPDSNTFKELFNQ